MNYLQYKVNLIFMFFFKWTHVDSTVWWINDFEESLILQSVLYIVFEYIHEIERK